MSRAGPYVVCPECETVDFDAPVKCPNPDCNGFINEPDSGWGGRDE